MRAMRPKLLCILMTSAYLGGKYGGAGNVLLQPFLPGKLIICALQTKYLSNLICYPLSIIFPQIVYMEKYCGGNSVQY